MTSFFLGADGTVFAHLTVAVQLQRQRCPLLTYLYISFYHITVCVYCSPVFLETEIERENQ